MFGPITEAEKLREELDAALERVADLEDRFDAHRLVVSMLDVVKAGPYSAELREERREDRRAG